MNKMRIGKDGKTRELDEDGGSNDVIWSESLLPYALEKVVSVHGQTA